VNETPLHLATRNGKLEIVKMLLSNDADQTIVGDSGTARDIAFMCNQQEILDLLDGRLLFHFDDNYNSPY